MVGKPEGSGGESENPRHRIFREAWLSSEHRRPGRLKFAAIEAREAVEAWDAVFGVKPVVLPPDELGRRLHEVVESVEKEEPSC